MNDKDLPRRIRLDLMTPEELALYNMVDEIEKLGAHPLLTDVVVLLGDARSKLSDWVDLQAAEHGVQADGAYCVCPQSLIPVVGNAPTECPYCHQPRR